MRLRENLLGPGRVQGQVGRHELQRVSGRPQPWQVRLLETTRRHQLRALGNARDHHAQHIVTGRRPQLVKIIEHDHERNRARPEGRGQARRRASQYRHAGPAHIGDQAGVGRPGPGIRGCQQREHKRRIIVQTVERHPHDRAILGQSPLHQQRRLTVTRRRRHADHPAPAPAGLLDEPGPAHETRARWRNRKLGIQQQQIRRNHRPRTSP